MQLTIKHPVVEDIVRVFQVSPEFVLEYMSGQSLYAERFDSWASLAASLNASQMMYVEFAMTCVLRARAVVELLQRHVAQVSQAPRYLDVGCGYGGFVREFALRGYDATGVELQAHLARMSMANCQGLPARVINSDFLALDPADLGTFDIITCNDVIEHVSDPDTVIARMCGMLRPGGVLFMEIPNRDCIESVISDGHFQVFGLTQLERNAAARYLAISSGRDDYLEQMGELYPLAFYRDALRRHGADVSIQQQHVVGNIPEVPRWASRLAEAYAAWTEQSQPRLDPHLRMHVHERLADYQRRLWSDYGNAVRGQGREDFELRYLNSFWSVIARR